MKILPALLLAICALGAHAQQDPLKSAACGAALADLQSARQGHAGSSQVESLRGAAATACLGNASLPSRPGRVVQAPVIVPPPQIEVPQQAAPLAAPVPPPPVAIGRPPSPATCDPSGCWSNDGSHLRFTLPSVPGPAGPCTQQGVVVYCP